MTETQAKTLYIAQSLEGINNIVSNLESTLLACQSLTAETEQRTIAQLKAVIATSCSVLAHAQNLLSDNEEELSKLSQAQATTKED